MIPGGGSMPGCRDPWPTGREGWLRRPDAVPAAAHVPRNRPRPAPPPLRPVSRHRTGTLHSGWPSNERQRLRSRPPAPLLPVHQNEEVFTLAEGVDAWGSPIPKRFTAAERLLTQRFFPAHHKQKAARGRPSAFHREPWDLPISRRGASSWPRPGHRANAPWSRPPLPSRRTCPRPCPGRRRRSRRHGPCACPEAPRRRR